MKTAKLSHSSAPQTDTPVDRNALKTTVLAPFIAVALVFLIASSSVLAAVPLSFLGNAAVPSASTRTININADTRFVNVGAGDTIQFVVGEKTFTWNFNVGSSIYLLDLKQIAPPGVLDHSVKVYIATDPNAL